MKRGLLVSALIGLTGVDPFSGLPVKEEKKKKPVRQGAKDLERMEAAKAKRERKAQARLKR